MLPTPVVWSVEAFSFAHCWGTVLRKRCKVEAIMNCFSFPPSEPSVTALHPRKKPGTTHPPVDLSHNPALPGTAPKIRGSLQSAPGGTRGDWSSPKPPVCSSGVFLSPSTVLGHLAAHSEAARIHWGPLCSSRLAPSLQWHPVLWEVIFCWRAPQCLLLCSRLTFVPD